jgi:hypothetical protein
VQHTTNQDRTNEKEISWRTREEDDTDLGIARGLVEERLAEGEDPLLHADAAALDHDVVLVDDTVVGEAAHRGDGLLGEIELGGRVLVLEGSVRLLRRIA